MQGFNIYLKNLISLILYMSFFLVHSLSVIACVEITINASEDALVSNLINESNDDEKDNLSSGNQLFNQAGSNQAGSNQAGSNQAGSNQAGSSPIDDRCEPNQPLEELCTACNVNGQRVAALNDDDCPALDCSTFVTYEKQIVGDQSVCLSYQYSSGVQRCASLGTCATLAQYCQKGASMELLRVATANECIEMTGCQGNTMGTQNIKTGASCGEGGIGTCNEMGACIGLFKCDETTFSRYNQENIMCDDKSSDMVNPFCEYYIHKNGWPAGGDLSCQAFCEANQATCLTAWDNAQANSCAKQNNQIECTRAGTDRICRCKPN
jgi:hypothetical protein